MRGKKGRGAGKKIVAFGVLKRQGEVYTRIVPNASRKALKGVIESKIDTGSTVYSDGWKSYDAIIDWGSKSTTGSIMSRTSSPGATATLTELRALGAWLK